MRLRNEAKVGLIVFSGIVALIAIYWFLGGLSLRASSYPIHAIFLNAEKLDKGAMVRMAGVKVGVVSEMRLAPGARARVDMRIWNDIDIPDDSVAQITTGGFIGENYVEIVPGKSRKFLEGGRQIRAEMLVGPEDLLADAAEVVRELKQSARGINELLGDKKIIGQIKDTVAAMKRAAESACALTDEALKVVAASSPRIDEIFDNVTAAAASAREVAAEMNSMLARDVRPATKSILGKADDLMKRLDDSVAQAQRLVAEYKGSGEGFSRALASADKTIATIDEAARDAGEMLKKLNEASGGIKDIATDPEIKADLKKTIKNAAEASEQAKGLIKTMSERFGPKPSPTEYMKSSVPDYGVAVNALVNTQESQSRVDAYYTFLGPGREFYRVGAYSIGENTGVIAQGGLVLNGANAFRYGVYDSQVGVGYDRRIGGSGLISLDWFRPNYGQLEARGTVGIGDAFGIYAGVNDLIHQQNRDLLVGLRYRK